MTPSITPISAPGSMAAHDDLCEAFGAWRDHRGRVPVAHYRRLLSLAENCGMAPEEPFPLMWIKRRTETYRREIGGSNLHPVFAEIIEAYFPARQAVRT